MDGRALLAKDTARPSRPLVGRSIRNSRLLILGLDGAGKTSMCAFQAIHATKLPGQLADILALLDALLRPSRLPPHSTKRLAPTVGFNFAVARVCNTSFDIWDVGGQDRIRSLWRHYFNSTWKFILPK